jgi:hypothetical protein
LRDREGIGVATMTVESKPKRQSRRICASTPKSAHPISRLSRSCSRSRRWATSDSDGDAHQQPRSRAVSLMNVGPQTASRIRDWPDAGAGSEESFRDDKYVARKQGKIR